MNELSSARVLIGALGQKMVALAGEACDGVILNWLTPNAAAELAPKTRRAAREAGKTDAHVVAYVRTAANPAAQTRLNVESEAYEGYPSYKRHFDRMGVRAVQTTVNGTASEIDAFYGGFEPSVDELVCRAIAATDSLEDYLVVLDAAAPGTEV